MSKSIVTIGLLILVSFSCQRKYVCPAYQSSFYLDKKKTEDFFSLFGADSLPKSDIYVNKNKYGIIVKVKYRKRQKSLNTVKMETVFPPPTDSLLLASNLAFMDSSSIDTLFTQSYKNKFKFNRDQQLYMIAMDPYLDYESDDDEEEMIDPTPSENVGQEDTKPHKKGWWPFRKKDNKEKESEEETTGEDNSEED